MRQKKVESDADVKLATQLAQKEIPGAKVAGVYHGGGEAEAFWNVQLDGGGELFIDRTGRVLSSRVPITKDDFPEPVAKTVQSMFNAPIEKLWRAEEVYYQFDEQSQTGQPVVVKMRPNGDILSIRNETAAQEERATAAQAKSKQGPNANGKSGGSSSSSKKKG